MSRLAIPNLRLLDQCLQNRQNVAEIRAIFEKIEKCCYAVDRKLNLADVLCDKANYQSLLKLFGPEGVTTGIQLILKVSLADFASVSFSLGVGVEGRKRIDFLHHSVGGWKQFEMVLCLNFPEHSDQGTEDDDLGSLVLLNPKSKEHWRRLEKLPQDTLVTLYLKTVFGKRSQAQENVAFERFKAVFDVVQSRNDLAEEGFAPVSLFSPNKTASSKQDSSPVKRTIMKSSPISFGFAKAPSSKPGAKLSLSFQVVINKTDTFVHAGNAQLIITHLASFSGRVEMYVTRGQKFPVSLDPDSIWSAEIRNGETVIYDFYGSKPSEVFLKELVNRTNKYTQMDKIANE